MSEVVLIDISEWVEKARTDPVLYLERQATEIVLNTIGMLPEFRTSVFLKGGALMGVVYGSPRLTADLDFTTSLEPQPNIDEIIRQALDEALPQAAARLGYPDIVCRVQSIDQRPRPDQFAAASFPALKVKIGFARRDSPQERLFNRRRSPDVVELDISFNDPIAEFQLVKLGAMGATIRVYSLLDLIAEKFRALLQQKSRNRYRRQDIYDIALLLKRFNFDSDQSIRLHGMILEKCRSRQIEPNSDSLSDPEVIRRARSEWDTLSLEVGEVPSFDECFAMVAAFYRSLPWETA